MRVLHTCCCLCDCHDSHIIKERSLLRHDAVLLNRFNRLKRNPEHISNLKDSASSGFEDKLELFLHLFCRQWKSFAYGIFSRGHAAFELDTLRRYLRSSHWLLRKSNFKHFDSFHIIVPQSKGKFGTGMPKL